MLWGINSLMALLTVRKPNLFSLLYRDIHTHFSERY
jgi:hypothetical protein